MELRTLQYFLAVAREENISRAAEVLHVTQPSLSRQIASLERELGTKLFIRGRHLQLTEAGMALRARAQEVADLMDRIDREFEERREVSGIVSIGSGGLMAMRTMTPIMAGFRQRYPRVSFEIYSNHADYVREKLDRGLLDFGVLLQPGTIDRYAFLHLPGRERWGLLVRADSPLAERNAILREDLRGLPLLIPERNAMQKELESWLGRELVRLNVFGTVNMLIPNTVDIVRHGDAACLTVEGAAYSLSDDLRFVPLDPPLEMSSILAWKRVLPSSAAGLFLEYCRGILSAHDSQ